MCVLQLNKRHSDVRNEIRSPLSSHLSFFRIGSKICDFYVLLVRCSCKEKSKDHGYKRN